MEMLLLQSPTISPLSSISGWEDPQQHWRNFDSTVTALSFGFVATAVLVSMFLAMAIFERLLRQRSPGGGRDLDLEAHNHNNNNNNKLHYPPPPCPKTSPPYAKDMSSVLMPGEQVPTFIAHSAPTTIQAIGSLSV